MPRYSTDQPDAGGQEAQAADGGAHEYRPWDADPPASTAAHGPEATDAFAAPPGLTEPVHGRKQPEVVRWRRTHTAAMMLNWTGGFLLFAGVLGLLFGGMGASLVELDWEYHGDRHALNEARDVRSVTGLVFWPMILLAAPFLAAGTGLLYGQRWARPLGITVGVLGLLLVPVGTLLNGIALAMFGGGAGEDP